MSEYTTDRIWQEAIRSLSLRSRSCQEMRERLSGKGHSAADIAATIQRLAEYGYLDDRKFARDFVEAYRTRWPRERIRQKLRLKGLSETDIQTSLVEGCPEENEWLICLTETRRLWAVETQRQQRYFMRHEVAETPERLSDRQTYAKIMQKLLQRGFTISMARQTLQRVIGQERIGQACEDGEA
ncbi:MAG: RecX family transcriptional regulator [Peptococcaceae bacterium]|nr:RecX family transcriptional regulator [Peptococcaceae bacterium]